MERQNAHHFKSALISFLPTLLNLRSILQVDEALQEFSSKYCEGNFCLLLQDFRWQKLWQLNHEHIALLRSGFRSSYEEVVN